MTLFWLPHPSWDESYASNQLPWDTGQPEPLLVEFLASSSLQPGPTLEIGAGTGTNAIWMAERGFDVLGVDVSPQPLKERAPRLRDALCAAALLHWTFSSRLCPAARSSSCSTAVAFMCSMNQTKGSGSLNESQAH